MSTVALNVSTRGKLSCSYCEQKPSRIASMTVSDCKHLQLGVSVKGWGSDRVAAITANIQQNKRLKRSLCPSLQKEQHSPPSPCLTRLSAVDVDNRC